MPDNDPVLREARDDFALLDAHLAGDPEAFGILAERVQRLIAFIAWQILNDRADVEDVIQDVLFSVHRSAAAFDRRASFRTWVARIARNAALDVRRRRAARPTVELTEVHERSAGDGPETDRVAGDRVLVDELLWRLPESARQILVMIDLLDLSFETVADVLELPVGTVKSRRFRALRALAEQVQR